MDYPSDPIPADFQQGPLATPAPPPAEKPLLHRIFFGPFGLRAGWSILIFILILFAIQRSANLIIHHMHHAHQAATKSAPAAPAPDPNAPQPLPPMLLVEGILTALILFVTWLMSKIEHRRAGVYGLGGVHSVSRFFIGAFWGLVALSLLVGSLCALHVLVFDARILHGLPILGYGLAMLLGFLLVGLFEEYLFRGFFQFTLMRGFIGLGNLISPKHSRTIAFWIASTLTSALFLFAHTHNAGENKIGLISVFLAGLVFVVALWRTGSLWWAIGFHMAWDWAQSFLYGVPDSGGLMEGRLFATHAPGNPILSGGTVGPEGSVLIIPVLCFVLIALMFTSTSPQPPLETLPSATSNTPDSPSIDPQPAIA